MRDAFLTALIDAIASGLELAGVATILVGLSAALIRAAPVARRNLAAAYVDLRSNVGRAILLGLELLVAADIIATITAPQTPESVGLLAAIVLIRTFLSFSLETEIEGRPPWLRAPRSSAGGPPYREGASNEGP